MNIVETFLKETKKQERTTSFKHGTYIIMRHNTMDSDKIIEDFKNIYSLTYQLIKGVKVNQDNIRSTPRVPAPGRVNRSVETQSPLMVSSVEQKFNGNKSAIMSHHYLYGGQWSLNHNSDEEYAEELKMALPHYIGTMDKSSRNILIQPVGITEEQILDRTSDDTLHDYISSYLNDSDEDCLLTQMVKQSMPGLKYALYYSYTM